MPPDLLPRKNKYNSKTALYTTPNEYLKYSKLKKKN